MSKKYFSLITLCLLAASIMFAQKKVQLNAQSDNFKISEKSLTTIKFTNSISAINFESIATKEGEFTELHISGFNKSFEIGMPDLPVINKLVEIPRDAEIVVNIISFTEEIINLSDYQINTKIKPAQPSLSKSEDPKDAQFVINREVYQTNSFAEHKMVNVEMLGIMRGTQIGRLTVSPFSYNPVTNVLKVANNLVVEVKFVNSNKEKTNTIKGQFYSPYYNRIMQRLVNYQPVKSINLAYPVKYVIISDPMFEAALQPFIQWKIKKGFNVVVKYKGDPAIGTSTTSIKSYLTNLYNAGTETDPAPSFLLIVGDVAQIPTFDGTSDSHVTDLYYACYDGSGDIYPDINYGRFSASNLTELQPQIDKTLEYEQYLMADPSFLDEVVMVSGVDGSHADTWGNGQINYGTTYYFNAEHGITSHTYLYPASGSSASQIIADVSAGVAYANYTAHCSPDGWADPNFGMADVAGLQNAGKYPLMVGNCCSSVEFQITCFGETLLRAANKGAIGYIGGSNSSYWDEDYYWGVGFGDIVVNPTYENNGLGSYDAIFHENSEPEDNIALTQAQMNVAGNMAVTESGSSRITYYWEIYHLMGDPSLMVYMSQPEAIEISYLDPIFLGLGTLNVSTEPGVLVALSMDGELKGTAYADAMGEAVINFEPFVAPGDATIVATAQNRQPYIATIQVIPNDGPYVLLDQFVVADMAGNNNNQADYAETVNLNVALKNVGSDPSQGITAVLSTEDQYIQEISTSTHTFGNISANQTVTADAAFTFVVKDIVPDKHQAVFNLNITDNSGNAWNSTFKVMLCSPIINVAFESVDVSGTAMFTSIPVTSVLALEEYIYNISVLGTDGDNNGRLDPGETTELSLNINNTGTARLNEASTCVLTSQSEFITINNSTVEIPSIEALSTALAKFNITALETTPIGTSAEFTLNFNTKGFVYEFTFTLKVGLTIEDFETNDFDSYAWAMAGNADWVTTNSAPYEGMYCAKSGAINDDQTTELTITLNVLMNDMVSFYAKVSSENNYDMLHFIIDNNEVSSWSGDQAWVYCEFPITAGLHTLKWVYEKDYSVSSGSDCAWIDYVVLPANDGATKANFTIVASTLPQWLTLTDNGDGTAVLSGTPTNNDAVNNGGNHNVVLEVEANNTVVKQEFTINVEYNTAINTLTDSNINFNVSPNPVISSSTINYNLNEAAVVKVEIFNLVGSKISQPINERLAAGSYNIHFNKTDLQAGIYMCKLTVNDKEMIQKIIVTK